MARFKLNAYRLAACALVLFTLGHTLGAVVETPDFGPESMQVVTAMKTVHVDADGAHCTWYGFYRAEGILVSFFFVFSVVMAWHVGGRTLAERRALLPVTWALFATYAASIVTGVLYLFPVPTVFSTVVTLLLGIACFRDQRAKHAAPAT